MMQCESLITLPSGKIDEKSSGTSTPGSSSFENISI